MSSTLAPHIYNVNKSGQFGLHARNPLKLLLWPDKIVVEDRSGTIVFSCLFKNMIEAGYDLELGWWFVSNDGKKFSILTHGIFSFANWDIRKTDVNERIQNYLNVAGVQKAYGSQPIIRRKNDKFLEKLLSIFKK